MILDTSFLVDVLRGEADLEPAIEDLDAGGPVKVTAITVMELWEGVHRSETTPRERQAVEDLLMGLHEVPFDRERAMVAGELAAALSERGVRIETADVQIAAAALLADEPVVTRDAEHFERVEGLEVVAY